jgi:2-keto-3-deoxy-6-phosphogluconate aldolase
VIIEQGAKRVSPSAILHQNPVIAVLRARHASEYAPVIASLAEGGVRSIELTLSTAEPSSSPSVLGACSRNFPLLSDPSAPILR